jgi:PTS system cellobiose-specific IIC component
MNPTLFIPLIVVPMVNATLAYFALNWDLVEKMVAMAPWTAPAPLGAMISASWDIRAALLVLILMAIDLAIWLPFFKVYEKQLLAQELQQADAEREAANTAAAQ